MLKLPKTPTGWKLKYNRKEDITYWGNVQNNKNFDIMAIFADNRGGWSVEKQHSTFFGERRMLIQTATKQKAISRAMKYMRIHKGKYLS